MDTPFITPEQYYEAIFIAKIFAATALLFGIMIAAYICTRMIDALGRQAVNDVAKTFAALALIVALACMAGLFWLGLTGIDKFGASTLRAPNNVIEEWP